MLSVVANLLAYKMAGRSDIVERSIQTQIKDLWRLAHGGRDKLLEQLSGLQLSSPEGATDFKAIYGKKFCEKVISIIDEVHANSKTISMNELRTSLTQLATLIDTNKHLKFSSTGRPAPKSGDVAEKPGGGQMQFEHVSALIYSAFTPSSSHERAAVLKAGATVRTMLSSILAKSIITVEKLDELEELSPELFQSTSNEVNSNDSLDDLPSRFDADRGQLSRQEIEWFVRNKGSEYGINNTDDWGKLLSLNPELKPRLTTMINALRRGKVPTDDLRTEIKNALDSYSSEPA